MEKLQISLWSLLLGFIKSFNDLDVSSFITINLFLPIDITNKQIWPFLACFKSLFLAQFFHLHHILSSNKTWKHLSPFSQSIGLHLLLLHLFNIPKDSFVHSNNQLYLSNYLLNYLPHSNFCIKALMLTCSCDCPP